MKILFFNQYFWPESFRINDIASALKTRGHNIEVLTGKPNYPEGSFFAGYKGLGVTIEHWRDIKIHRIPMLPRGNKSALKLAINYISFIISGLVFAPWVLRNKQYDVIFVYAPSPIFQVIPASFLGWLKGIPVILWVQDLWPQSAEATGYIKSPLLLKLLQKFVRFTYSHIDLILVQSEAFIEPVKSLAENVPIQYYPNSVDKEFYKPSGVAAPEIDSLKSGFTILFAGNIGIAQSMETIVSAAEKLAAYSEIKLVLIGTGSMFDWVQKQVTDKRLTNLFLEGRYPVEVMPAVMRQASALLVTLTKQPIFELTIPSKIQAYLAVGKPIVACLNGEGANIINKAKAGIAVKAEDGEGLAEAIINLYKMPQTELEQMGVNGRDYFKKHFDEEKLTSELISHFEMVINNKEKR
ncbi:glycosyltransferase family 4 protein [Methylotenera sp. 1P/1]|uniref:glycosyltransferase family 4 protein n=1 Tax=Methylotenera sp. 1P/1 TaxID=1131551 RepID=UPI00037DFEE1|nr:glycosyltransferase family 4 protein [Methylotenera sp. 1P/1]